MKEYSITYAYYGFGAYDQGEVLSVHKNGKLAEKQANKDKTGQIAALKISSETKVKRGMNIADLIKT